MGLQPPIPDGLRPRLTVSQPTERIPTASDAPISGSDRTNQTAKVVSDNIDEEDTNIASLNATFSDELLDISRRLPG